MAASAQSEAVETFAPEVFSGTSPAAERLRLQVARFAPHFRSLLLSGEPGVGKGSVARELHRLGPLAVEPFAQHTIPEFLNGAAEDPTTRSGTLYLCGLATADLREQELLLGRLTRLPREIRVVVGCECDPRGLVAAGRLQPEVYARLGMLEIRVAPLRERIADLETLVNGMLRRLSCGGMDSALLLRLEGHRWPGNLAELWRICAEFAASGHLALPQEPAEERAETVRLEAVIERHVRDVLEQCAGNKLKAAELLGISRSTLYRMLDAAAG